MPSSHSIVAGGPHQGSGRPWISVCICVATFRRPEGLARLLRSVANLKFAKTRHVDVRVVVVDNENQGSASWTVQQARHYLNVPLVYEIEPRRGISFARNRSVALAHDCDYVAFIDDDEFASEQWLDELLLASESYNADIVLGPVIADFDYDAPHWLTALFKRPRHPSGTIIEYGRTGNALVTKGMLDLVPGPFDPQFALTGGEDTLLFRQLLNRGARIVWCDEAPVTEVNGVARDFRWILRRAFAAANGYVLSERSLNGRSRLFFAIKGLLVLGSGLVVLLPALIVGFEKAARASALIARGLGHIAGALDVRYQQYA